MPNPNWNVLSGQPAGKAHHIQPVSPRARCAGEANHRPYLNLWLTLGRRPAINVLPFPPNNRSVNSKNAMNLLLRITLLLSLVLLPVACGESADSTATSGEPTTNAPAGAPATDADGETPDTATEGQAADQGKQWMEVAELPETNIFGESWTGDFDQMEERRMVRVLTVYSIGRYYLDHGSEKGLTYEMLKNFETFINEKKVRGHLKVHVVFIPVARNQLIPALLEGRGDLVAASLSITPEREEQVDFTIPASKPVSEILVTGPSAPPLESIEDLSGKTLYVRHSSSYRESVEELNQRLREAGKPPVIMEAVSELLEDDDLIEMVNGGLLPWAIVDDYKTQLWDGVFDQLVVRDDIVFKSGTSPGLGGAQEQPSVAGPGQSVPEEKPPGNPARQRAEQPLHTGFRLGRQCPGWGRLRKIP